MSLLPGPRQLLFRLGVFIGLQITSLAAAAAGHSYRPALVGNGPKSLVNLIDGQELIRKGQQDGVVMFDVAIGDDAAGSVTWIWCHAGPGSDVLKREVVKELHHASFVPAMIDDKRVEVSFHGTVIFMVRNGRPYLRVFANQDQEEIAKGGDYIQPQMLVDTEDWDGVQDMLAVVKYHARTGHAILSLTIDAEGKMRDRRLVREEPTGLNIGAAALKAYATAEFVPGFRNGKPVTCTFEENWAVRGYRYRR